MPAMIEIAAASKRYGAHYAVRDVDLDLAGGECVALVGHNGAGKSTLIKMMLGLCRPSAGTIRICGEDPAGRRGARLHGRLGYLPENVVFPPAMTGREVLDFYGRLKRRPAAANAGLLDRVGLGEAATRRVGTYSKGMRQRLGLAQALLGEPRLLLLDEPTAGLDPASRQSFYDIVAERRARGVTVLLSSHALDEIEGRTDRIVVMSGGRLAACGTLAELRGLANLPVRIQVELGEEDLAAALMALPSLSCQRLGARRLELACANDAKMEVLRGISAAGAAADIEILPPTLDDIYAHLMRRAAE